MQAEYGSDFHFIDSILNDTAISIQKIYPDSNLFFSGRAALFNLIQLGIKRYNWQYLFLPEYYCHDVDDFIKSQPIEVRYYPDGPYEAFNMDVQDLDRTTNVFVHVNYFGFDTHSRLNLKNAFVIEDHTHDLASEWALNSTAHYCFASLRKSMPVPVGGIIWSPQKLPLPVQTAETETGNTAVYMKLCAMLLKTLYLENGNIDKQEFRSLFIHSEQLFEKHETNTALPSAVSNIINKIPIHTLRAHRLNNYKTLSSALQTKAILWKKELNEQQCPFGCILFFNEASQRNALKAYLIEKAVYPAVLWPNQKQSTAKDFSGKVLFVHCDIRYNQHDMETIAAIINEFDYAG